MTLISSFPRKRESSDLRKQPCVYMLSSERNGTLYVGVTSDLVKRMWEHKQAVAEGFTKKYGISKLVWFELCDSMEAAIQREKQIKKWNRDWKKEMVQKTNPYWNDLYDSIV